MATTYTVTYDANGGSNAPSPDKKIYGQALTLTNDVPTPPAGIYYKSYTVTFNANGGTCDQDIMTSTTTITYDRFGYWATNPDGSGSLYWPGDLYTDNNDVILYAQYMWGSESLGITLPTPSRDNYDFLGWSENEYDTSGITGQYYPSKDITLYAIWEIKTYTVTYHANGGSGTTSSQTVTAGEAVTLRSNSFTAPTSRVWTVTLDGNGGNDGSPDFGGNYFSTWKTSLTADFGYPEGTSYTPRENTTMYAWWGTYYMFGTTTRDSTISEGYTVTFDANGGVCNTTSLTSIITTLYDFSGWGNSASDPTTIFKSDVIYGQINDLTVYAIWSPKKTNGSISLPTPTRNGYEFLGWSIDQYDTSGITGEYAPNEDGITLYAIWKPSGLVYIHDNIGEYNSYQVQINDGFGWNQYVPYIYTESGWEVYFE